MNEILNKFLLAGDKFMPEMQLRQPGFTYSACRLFTINTERIQKFKEKGESKYIYQNKLDKAWFQHDVAMKILHIDLERQLLIKILYDKIFDIAKNPKYDGYKRGLAGANASGGAVKSAWSETVDRQCKSVIENKIVSNQELAKELQKLILTKYEKRKVQ